MTILAPLMPAREGNMGYMSMPPIYERGPAEPRVLPRTGIAVVGTGGVASGDYFRRMHLLQMGYRALRFFCSQGARAGSLCRAHARDPSRLWPHHDALARGVRVSRQTLYNWLKGETQKPAHQEKLEQLAEAARVFSGRASSLPRQPSTARSRRASRCCSCSAKVPMDAKLPEKLMRIVQRGRESRAKLDELLGGRKARLEASDIGAPSLDEDA